MRKLIQGESTASNRLHPLAAVSIRPGPIERLARCVGLAFYMVDPVREAFDPALVTDYSGCAVSEGQERDARTAR